MFGIFRRLRRLRRVTRRCSTQPGMNTRRCIAIRSCFMRLCNYRRDKMFYCMLSYSDNVRHMESVRTRQWMDATHCHYTKTSVGNTSALYIKRIIFTVLSAYGVFIFNVKRVFFLFWISWYNYIDEFRVKYDFVFSVLSALKIKFECRGLVASYIYGKAKIHHSKLLKIFCLWFTITFSFLFWSV